MTIKYCECGCGRQLKLNHLGLLPRFILGHNNKNKKFSLDHRQKLSESHKGLVSGNKGHIYSEESREKIRSSHVGVPRTKQSIIKQKEIAKTNPNYGMKNKKHSELSKKKMKISLSKAWKEGKYKDVNLNIKQFKQGHFYSIKNKKKIHYRSSFELQAYQIFEQITKIIAYESEPFAISYVGVDNELHNYIPDVLITYDDKTQELIEIKPKYLITTTENILKFDAARKFAKENNLKFSVFTEDNLTFFKG